MSGRYTAPKWPKVVRRDRVSPEEIDRRVARCECPAFVNMERRALAKVHRSTCPVLISLKRVN